MTKRRRQREEEERGGAGGPRNDGYRLDLSVLPSLSLPSFSQSIVRMYALRVL